MLFPQLFPKLQDLWFGWLYCIIKVTKSAFPVIDLQGQNRSFPDDPFQIPQPISVRSDRLLNISGKVLILQLVEGILRHGAHDFSGRIQRRFYLFQRPGNFKNILAMFPQPRCFLVQYTALAVDIRRARFQFDDGAADLLTKAG